MKLSLQPRRALVDETLGVRVEGLRAGERARVHAEFQDDSGRAWHSATEFRADAQGAVDTRTAAAHAGSYRGVQPMGWLSSMRPEQPRRCGLFVKSGVAPTPVQFRVETSTASASRAGWIDFIGPEVDRYLLKEQGLVAELHLPRSRGPHPVVVVLPGWPTGGLPAQSAALLASRGVAALALGYFAAPGLPSRLAHISIDYFVRALDWIEQQAELDAERIAVIGYSRGAELALILGSTFPRIRGTIAFLPSSVPIQAASWRPFSRPQAWVWDKRPIPFLPLARPSLRTAAQLGRALYGAPLRVRPFIEESLRNQSDMDELMIPVERCAGPVLLFSAGDDAIWPSPESCEQLMRRLETRGHRHARKHVHYPAAGHELWFSRGALPSTRRFRKLGACVTLGGGAAADAEASRDSWQHVQAFLKECFA